MDLTTISAQLVRTVCKLGTRQVGRLAFSCAAAIALSTPLAGPAVSQTLDRIASAKMIRLSFVPDQAPFSFVDAAGVPAGYSIELCGKVVSDLQKRIPHLQATFVETPLTDAFAAVATGRVDMLCGAITITLGRRELVDFSQPIFLSGTSALLRAGAPPELRELASGVRTIASPRSAELRPFATTRIGVRMGSTAETSLRRVVAQEGYGNYLQIVALKGPREGLQALESQNIDAYFGDRTLLAGVMGKARYPAELTLASRLFTYEPYGIAIARGDPDFRLLIDRTLSGFFRGSEFGPLLGKYFGQEASKIRSEIAIQAIPD
jgi:polar amino acid transport system substrate-binding protein